MESLSGLEVMQSIHSRYVKTEVLPFPIHYFPFTRRSNRWDELLRLLSGF